MLLEDFGVTPLSDSMDANAEAFLMKTLGTQFCTADDFRFHDYHQKKVVNFERLTPTSTSVRLHIKRAYYQCHRWINALSAEEQLDPLEYGYIENDGALEPQITSSSILPADFPIPSCIKCYRDSTCCCRSNEHSCCVFCKCKSGDICNNPYK